MKRWILILSLFVCSLALAAEDSVRPTGTAPASELKEVLTLEDCLRLAERNNPQYQVSALVEDMAKEDLKTARGAFFPTIVGSATYWHVDDTPSLPVIPGSLLFTEVGARDNFLIGGTAVQPIYDHTLIAAHKVASKQRKVADYNKQISQKNALGNVKKAFYTALFYKEVANFQKDFGQTSSQELERTQARFRRGVASGLEVAEAEGVEALSRTSYQESLAKFETAKDHLKRLIGYPLEQEIILKGDLDELAQAAEAPSSSDEGQSPPLKIANAQYELAKAATGQKLSEFFPKIYGSFNLYLTNPNLLVEPNDEFRLHYWAGGTLQIPVFDGLRNLHQYHKAKAQEKISFILKKEVEAQEAIKQRNQERVAQPSNLLEGPKKSYQAAEKSYQVAEVAYKNRLISYPRWVQAQRQYAKARVEYAAAQLRFLSERVDQEQFEPFRP